MAGAAAPSVPPEPISYRYLGERAVEPSRSIIIACPDCHVYWGGCAAESDCPECGKPADYFHDQETLLT